MTKLELINEEIELVKDYLKDRKIYKLNSKRYTPERLQLLQQIKTDLEAWESIKPYLVVEKRFVNLYEDDFKTIELRNGCIDELESGEDYSNLNKIIKALEVEDE